MAQYLVTYTNGCDQHITADKVHLNSAEGHYVFTTSNGERVAFTPLSGVLSIVRMPEPSTATSTTHPPAADNSAPKRRGDWCCSLAYQTNGKQHVDDCTANT